MAARWLSLAPMHTIHRAVGVASLCGLGIAAGCTELDPAPEDLDGLFHYTWSHYADGKDEELSRAAVNAHRAVDGALLEDVLEGTVSDLDRAALDLVGMGADVSAADPVGLFRVGVMPCSLAQVEVAVVSADQGELYADLVDGFSREYAGDEEAYLDGETATLSWVTEIEDSLAGTPYVKQVAGGIRRVPVNGAGEEPSGPVLVTRSWLVEPAVFEGGGDYFWDQDYQVELLYERAAGEAIHLLALWRHVGMGAITSDNEFMQTMILEARGDWDERTAELCEGGSV